MAKRKAKIRYETLTGVGLDIRPSPGGMHPMHSTSVVLAIHPVEGTRVLGPFVTSEAARNWLQYDGPSLEGVSRECALYVVPMDVPFRYLS
jgi:hypothetical protein